MRKWLCQLYCMAQSWGMKVTERQKLNVSEMKRLRSMTDVSRLDRVKNEVESENRCEERIGS